MLAIKAGQVRMGVEAPKHVPVHREEIYERIRAERNSSTAAAVALEFPLW